MALSVTYPTQLDFQADRHVARWRPLVQWLFAIPQLLIVRVLGILRGVLTLISFFTVLFTKRIPRPLFDTMAMTFRYEWRAVSYALFLHEDYPPFDFHPGADDNHADRHSSVTFAYPTELSRWRPFVKWFLAIPHYFVLMALFVASVFVIIAGFFAVIVTGEYPTGARNFLVAVSRWSLRVQAYVGLLTDTYPPFEIRS